MTRYGMVMDITRCNGCYNCFLACRDEFSGNDFLPYSASQPKTGHFWMRLVEKERGQYPKVKVAYTAVPCMHCEEPRCAAAAQYGAVYRREDGIVIIDPEKGAEQRQIVDSCPHRVIFWNDEKRVAQKCTFCAHLLDAGWKEPRCVEACPTDALIFGDLDDPESDISKLIASGQTEELHPEYGLGSAVRYVGLPKRFVAGAVVFADTDACGEGAEVTLQDEAGGSAGGPALAGPVERMVVADNYGDFEFEGLTADKVYRVTVRSAGYETRELTARTNVDLYLGDIVLQPAADAGTTAGAGAGAAAAARRPPAPATEKGAGDGREDLHSTRPRRGPHPGTCRERQDHPGPAADLRRRRGGPKLDRGGRRQEVQPAPQADGGALRNDREGPRLLRRPHPLSPAPRGLRPER